jgi:hypothetical protein
MMTFGWRPDQSCYKSAGSAGSCSTPFWFYALAAAALLFRKK